MEKINTKSSPLEEEIHVLSKAVSGKPLKFSYFEEIYGKEIWNKKCSNLSVKWLVEKQKIFRVLNDSGNI